MQPESQVDILIWRPVLRFSMSSEYIKAIKPPRHTVLYKMSSNYMLYSSLSLIFTSHSVKTYYTHTHQAAVPADTAPCTAPTKVLQAAGTSSKAIWRWLGQQVSAVSCVSLTAYAGWAQSSSVLGPAAQEEPTSHAQSQACDWSHWFQRHQARRLLFQSWRCGLALNGQRIQGPRIQTGLCVFGGFITVIVSFVCPRALSGRILATF